VLLGKDPSLRVVASYLAVGGEPPPNWAENPLPIKILKIYCFLGVVLPRRIEYSSGRDQPRLVH